jgi:type II secretion system protein G
MRVSQNAPFGGFTMIELLIVTIVVGILAAITVPMYMNQREKAKDTAVKQGIHSIQTAIVTYAADNNGAYPATAYVTSTPDDAEADNLGNTYLSEWPENPWTGEPMRNAGSVALAGTDLSGKLVPAESDSELQSSKFQAKPLPADSRIRPLPVEPDSEVLSGSASPGDFSYVCTDPDASYGLVGWMAEDEAFVLQPLQ